MKKHRLREKIVSSATEVCEGGPCFAKTERNSGSGDGGGGYVLREP